MESLNGLDILINAKDNATQVLQSIQSNITTLGSEGSSQLSRINEAAEGVRTRLTGMYAAVTALVAGFVGGKLVQVPAQFESINAQLTTVTKSSALAQEATKWVTDFAAKTPYELDQVSRAYAKLLSYGFDPKTLLEPIGNAASGMQKTLDEAVEAFADATRGEYERLKEFGINAEVSGNQVTLSWMQNGQQMEKTVTKNAENIGKALTGVWTDMFKGGMESQMSTWTGRVSNLMDAVTRGIQKFMSGGLFDALKEKVATITDAVEELEQSGSLEEWGRIAAAAFTAVWDAGKRLVEWITEFVSRYGDLLKALATEAAILMAVSAFGSLAKGVASAISFLKLFKTAAAAAEIGTLALSKAMLAGLGGWITLILCIPDAIKGYKNAALALNEWLNPLSKTNQANKQAAAYQQTATENNKKADAAIKQYAASLGYTVNTMDEWRKGLADGTIKLRDHAGNVALTADEYKKAGDAIKKAQTAGTAYISQVADRYDQQANEAKKLAETEGAAAANSLAVQRDKYKAVLPVAQAVAEQQIAYINQVGGTEQQKAALRAKVEENLQAAKKTALDDWLAALKSGLDEALSQEKRYAQESENAHKTTEDKIRELRRQTMDTSTAYYDQVAEANEKLAKAEQAAATGTAEGYDRAMQYAKEAQNAFVASATAGKDSVDSYTAVQTAVRGVAEAGKVWEDAANAGKTAWADTVQAFKDQIADAKAKLDELKNNPVGVNLTCDTTAVDKALDALRSTKTTSSHRVDPNTADAFKAIADLKKDTYSTHYVTVKTVEEKASTSSPILPSVIPRSYYEGSSSMALGGVVSLLDRVYRFATGGSVPVMTMPGEVVVEPERAGRLAPLLHAINSLRFPVDAILHRATGGDVFRPFASGLIPGVGDEDSEPLLLRQGAFVVRKSAVQRYGADLINSLGRSVAVPHFADGGVVLPDWLRRLQATFAPAPAASSVTPEGETPPPVMVAPAAASPVLSSPLPARRPLSVKGTSALGRLNALRGQGLTAFSSGGSLDETLADIALERKRTQEDYDESIADAQADHNDSLAALLAQEQSDLADIAKTLADALADLQKTWSEAQKAYASDMADAKAALSKAGQAYDSWKYNADISYSATNNEGSTVLYSQDQIDKGYKTNNGYINQANGGFIGNPTEKLQHFANGGVTRWYKWKYSSSYGLPAKTYNIKFQDYSSTAAETQASLQQAIRDAGDKVDEVQQTYNEAQETYYTGVAEAKETFQDDTDSKQESLSEDKAKLDADLADKLDDLKKSYDRTMEDLDIKETRARADAEETGDYSITGFSQWLREGGPVAALHRVQRLAEGGLARLFGRLPRFAGGGAVPLVEGAERGVDSVIAALTPGEGVINLKAMGRIISERALSALNNLDLDGFLGELPRFAGGGVVGSRAAASGISPSGAAAADGYTATLNLNLAGRSYETRTTRDTAAALARELRRQGANIK